MLAHSGLTNRLELTVMYSVRNGGYRTTNAAGRAGQTWGLGSPGVASNETEKRSRRARRRSDATLKRTTCASAASALPETEAAVHAALSSVPRSWGKSRPDLIFVFASPRHDIARVNALLLVRFPGTTIVSTSSAGELTERGVQSGGLSILLVRWGDVSATPALVESMAGAPGALRRALLSRFTDDLLESAVRGRAYPVTLLFGDSFSSSLEKLVIEMGRTPLDDHVFAGAGAADDCQLIESKVALGAKAAVGGAVAVQLFSKNRWGVGTDLGLDPAGDRMTVTRAHKERVIELNGEPAVLAYQARVSRSGVWDSSPAPGQRLLTSELGLMLFDQLVSVRAPRKIEPDGSILLSGALPEGSTVSFVEGSAARLAEAASRAARGAAASLDGPAAGVLVFSSVSRRLRCEDPGVEVRAIAEVFPGVPIAGFASYAEVARTPTSLGGYYNSSIVVVAIPV